MSPSELDVVLDALRERSRAWREQAEVFTARAEIAERAADELAARDASW